MNIFVKMASAAALSVAALSVAALSVPSIKAHALKLIVELGVGQTLVANVVVKNKGVSGESGVSVMDPSIPVGFREVSVDIPPSHFGENAGGVFGAFGGVSGAGNSNNQDTIRNGFHSLGGGGLSAIALGTDGPVMRGTRRGAGQIAGGAGATPAGSVAPSEERVASNDSGSSLPSTGGRANTPPPQGSTAPGDPGEDEVAGLAPDIDIFKNVAALPPQPDDGLGNNPDSAMNAGPVAQPLVAIAAVPEPGTLALLGVALLGIGASRRRRATR